MAVSYSVEGSSFRTAKPRPWSAAVITPHAQHCPYDLHPDGLRIAMIKPAETTDRERDRAVFVFNFFDELRRVAPVK